MQPHIHSKTKLELIDTLNLVRRYVEDVPEKILGPDGDVVITPHNLVQAIAHHIRSLKPVHGYFDSACEHAWLQTPDPDFIIDPYPPFVLGGPILVYMSSAATSPWCRLYDADRRPTALDKPGLLNEVNAILEATERKRMFLGMP